PARSRPRAGPTSASAGVAPPWTGTAGRDGSAREDRLPGDLPNPMSTSLDGARLLVTGGAGFIGSNFVHHVLRRFPRAHVVVLDALTYAGRRENLEGLSSTQLTFVHGDIRNPEAVARAMADCEFAINFAAESHVDRSIEQPGEFIQTDV